MGHKTIQGRPASRVDGCTDANSPRSGRCWAKAGILGLACAALTILAGGCAGGKMTWIADANAFQEIVLDSNKPVLVDFYKGGCPTCIALDPVMDQLVDEYKGRVVVAKFETMTPFFTIPSVELKQKYDIVFFPTAILFVDGQVKKRWIIRYSIDSYRKTLDTYAPPPTTLPAGADKPQLSEKQ